MDDKAEELRKKFEEKSGISSRTISVTDEEFNNLLKKQVESNVDYYKKNPNTDQLIPMLMVYTKTSIDDKPELAILALAGVIDTYDTGEKAERFKTIGKSFIWNQGEKPRKIPVAVMFSTEAWMKRMNKTEDYKGEKGKSMKETYPDAEETLITMGETIDRRMNSAFQNIKRNGHVVLEKAKFNFYSPESEVGVRSPLLDAFFFGVGEAIGAFFNKDEESSKRN